MLNIIIAGLFIVIVCIFPVMFIARKLGAEKTDLMDCIIAVIAGSFVSGIVVSMLTDQDTNIGIQAILSIIITGIVYKFLLEATYIKGLLIALIPSVFYYALGSALA